MTVALTLRDESAQRADLALRSETKFAFPDVDVASVRAAAEADAAASFDSATQRVAALMRERAELDASAALLQKRVDEGEVSARQLEEQAEASARRLAACSARAVVAIIGEDR